MKRFYTMTLTVAFAACAFLSSPLQAQTTETSADPITDGSKVTLEMTITVPNEHLVIPPHKSEYTHGARELIPGLEHALVGMHAGEKKRVELDADHAFGQYDAQKKMTVPRGQLPETIQVGDVGSTSENQPFTVLSLSNDSAVIDFNHPLAGKLIVLDVRVLDVKRPQT
jgi:FKBP-type peptidyl-prolyl cis-trans isomerases 2